MPIQVDIEARLADIAAATLRVASSGGLADVTIRAVAAELGASTTFITNYLPTRAALLTNALRQIDAEWMVELEAELRGDDSAAALRRAMRSAVVWDGEELLRSQFWVAVLGVADRDEAVDVHLTESTAAVRALFAKLVAQCGHRDPDTGADLLVLVAQGAFISIVETPDAWPSRRLVEVADAAVDAVLAGI